MCINYIVSDWNGTLLKYPDECKLYSRVLIDIVKAQCWYGVPIHPAKLLSLAETTVRLWVLERRGRHGKEGDDYVERMYDLFNKSAISGMAVDSIQKSVQEYAKRAKKQVDPRMLRPISEARNMGKQTGILSAGHEDGIKAVLREAGYEHAIPSQDVVADTLDQEYGTAIGFVLRIYKNKRRFLIEEFINQRGFKPQETAYMGDSGGDEPCFEYLAEEGGYPIISFFASDDFKQRCAEKYNAFVPASEEELREYLVSAS